MRFDPMSLMSLTKNKSIDVAPTIDMHGAREIAAHWVTAWNAQDIDCVLSVYHDSVVFNSANAIAASVNRDGVLRGKLQLRNYFMTLLRTPENADRLSLIDVMIGAGGYALYYGCSNGQFVTSFAQIDREQRVIWVSEFFGARDEMQLTRETSSSL
jgi:ketosteroid isomerase-like protein